MSYVIPKIPPSCDITGRIYDSEDRTLLDSDMLEVFCPETDTLICVGWLPEEDLSGQYVISVYRDCEQIRVPYRSKLLNDVTSLVERMAIFYQRIHPQIVVYPSPFDDVEQEQRGPRAVTGSNPLVEYA